MPPVNALEKILLRRKRIRSQFNDVIFSHINMLEHIHATQAGRDLL
jgi:hypothetical protein